MELRQLRYVVAVADHLHFTRAAASLHVAQPALSQQVRRLERELGLELFTRTSRTVALTDAGEAVVARARRVLGEVDAIEEGLDAATQRVLDAAGIEPQVRFETNELTRVRALASRGLGVATMPRSDTVGPGPPVAAIAIGPPKLRRSVGVVWREGRRRAPAAEAFLAFVLEWTGPWNRSCS